MSAFVTVKPASSRSALIETVTSSRSGGVPAFSRMF
jgi:hypothetical protein